MVLYPPAKGGITEDSHACTAMSSWTDGDTNDLEALAVHDRRTGLVVLGLRDPHLLEGGQRREDGAANPHRVLALRRCHDLDLHGRRGEGRELLGHALADALKHGGTAREHDVLVQILADVHVALHDGLERAVMDARRLLADERRLEKHLRGAEALIAHSDDVAVRELVRLVDRRRLVRGLHLLVEVEGHVSELLLDVTHNLALGRGRKRVATLR